ncbi:hypothetical protein BD626DRAFT_479014 [Schizophyllum amplum]|uniref:BTB domain-containing protein n=1 Tax=Schizophyllum amplum TaxID=97359 RepID=A0A550CRV0_9AGAR|nr:hypothetical protein BD626DRAFT_479014 [Auriculariopsis ampla]
MASGRRSAAKDTSVPEDRLTPPPTAAPATIASQESDASTLKRKLPEDSDEEVEVVKSDDGVPNKKAKPSYTKHERFWLLDGNVVIQIGDTRYKLHRSRLASQSPWFEALFEKRAGREPKPDHGTLELDAVGVEEDEGYDVFDFDPHCNDDPIVDDDDFEELLKAMDDAIAFRYSSPTFLVHAAIYRAAYNLNFPAYRDYAQKVMEDEFSQSLDTVTQVVKPHAAEAVQLAEDWVLPSLFKRAFYELARNPDAHNAGIAKADSDTDANVIEERLMLQLLHIQKKLAQAWTEVVSPGKKLNCTTPKCHSDRPENYWVPIHQEGILKDFALDPICGLQALSKLDWTKYSHCATCRRSRRLEFTDKRVKLWKDMDSWLPE